MTERRFDVAIIGGGPAGASMASYLAAAGLHCVVIEREKFPRPHVGESLVPASTRVLSDIGFLPTMEAAGFPRKYGAAWTTGEPRLFHHDFRDPRINNTRGDSAVDIRFGERQQPGVDQDYTYHVDRGRFDQLLLQHAAALGATVWEAVGVKYVDFTDARQVRLECTAGNSESVVVAAKMVVDASGRRTCLGNQLRLKHNDPVFNQYAVHTWFEGYDRGNDKNSDFIFIHFLPITNTWIWQIPITESVTSFGVVTQKKHFTASKATSGDFFWRCLQSRPDLRDRLAAARRIRDFSVEGDYSYTMDRIVGDRFVMIGDAARFVDPIFSTGVSLALNAARLASRDILCAAEYGDFQRSSFSSYNRLIGRGMRNWYEFIKVYYRLNVLFTVFINSPAHRTEVLKLLQGDVYDEDSPAVLEQMKSIVASVEANPGHVWHKLLGDLTANDYIPA